MLPHYCAPDDVGSGLPLLCEQLRVVHDLLQEADHPELQLRVHLKVLVEGPGGGGGRTKDTLLLEHDDIEALVPVNMCVHVWGTWRMRGEPESQREREGRSGTTINDQDEKGMVTNSQH